MADGEIDVVAWGAGIIVRARHEVNVSESVGGAGLDGDDGWGKNYRRTEGLASGLNRVG
jgi:hypothetical protein